MNCKTTITLTIMVVCGLLALMGFTISKNFNLADEPKPSTSWPDEVDWSTAIKILRSGQVSEVIQSHNLEVLMNLDDGNQIKTIEPAIDQVFKEIDICGDICSDILLITE